MLRFGANPEEQRHGVHVGLVLPGFVAFMILSWLYAALGGVDAVEAEMTDLDCAWLERKLMMYGLKTPKPLKEMTKIVAGKQLWNYDNLEPAEKKLVL